MKLTRRLHKLFFHKKKSGLGVLYFLAAILALSNALPAYIQSNFLEDKMGISYVGWFFVIANIITLFAILYFPKIIVQINNYFSTDLVLILYIFSLVGLATAQTPFLILLSFIGLNVFTNLIWINLDLFVESFSKDSSTGKTRAIYFTFLNFGWVLAPFLSSRLVEMGGYELAFLSAAAGLLLFALIFIFQKKRLGQKKEYTHGPIVITGKKMWKNKNLRGIFLIAFLLNLFFNSAVVFIPMHLHQNLGFSWATLGIIFSVMLLPFVIFEIPAGIIADKYLEEKEILYVGFLILIASLVLFYYLKSSNPWLWGGLLFFSRIGAALVEAMRESYFFKQVSSKDVDYINFFRTTAPFGYIVGSAIGALIISILDISYLFIVIALILFSAFPLIFSLKSTK